MALVVGTNSYAPRADADTYFADSIRAAQWIAFSEPLRDSGMVEATRVFERQRWRGEKEISTQTLAFGRTGLTGKEGEAVTPAQSLLDISEAQFEYALALLVDASVLESNDATGSNVKSLKAGSAAMEFFRVTTGTRFPVIVTDIIGQYLLGSAAALGVTPCVSGTDIESGFEDRDQFGYRKPL